MYRELLCTSSTSSIMTWNITTISSLLLFLSRENYFHRRYLMRSMILNLRITPFLKRSAHCALIASCIIMPSPAKWYFQPWSFLECSSRVYFTMLTRMGRMTTLLSRVSPFPRSTSRSCEQFVVQRSWWHEHGINEEKMR